MTDSMRPFQLEIPSETVDDLRRRLRDARWPEPEPVADWSQGIPLAYLQEVCRYWETQYDHQRLARFLNAHDQFITEVDGVDVHLLHIRSPHANALPVVMTHGWPGSVVEFAKVIGPLTDPSAHGGDAADALHLVLPSMPGYGFSGKPRKTGWGTEKVADAWVQVMERLGYPMFGAQGGDWGAAVTSALGLRHPDRLVGIHLNMPVANAAQFDRENLTDFEQAAFASFLHYNDQESGYSTEQATRPQTIGYSLVDSPVGLAGWIIEKFWAWSDCNGNPENVFTRDELLDNVMTYWLGAAGASSARLYWESFRRQNMDPITVPTGISIFPKEIFRLSERWAATRYTNIVHYNQLDRGGHFAAFERPELFISEVRDFFRRVR